MEVALITLKSAVPGVALTTIVAIIRARWLSELGLCVKKVTQNGSFFTNLASDGLL
jgi:hypothetical protein